MKANKQKEKQGNLSSGTHTNSAQDGIWTIGLN